MSRAQNQGLFILFTARSCPWHGGWLTQTSFPELNSNLSAVKAFLMIENNFTHKVQFLSKAFLQTSVTPVRSAVQSC